MGVLSHIGNSNRNPFGWNGRLNWYSYLINMVLVIALYFGGDYLRYWAYLHDVSMLENIGYVFIGISFFRGLALTARRFHDFGISSNAMLCCYIVFILFSYTTFPIPGGFVGLLMIPFLFCFPGQVKENKYGPVPEKKISF